MELIINRGLPASGKSTQSFYDVQADFGGTIRVNRDDIRKMFHQSVFLGQTTEKNVEMARDAIIRQAMKKKLPKIISDDTNLNPSVVKHLAKIAEFYGYDVLVRDFNTDLKTCIERDAQREGSACVGEDVIRGMHKKWFKGGQFPENPLKNQIQAVRFEPYVPDTSLYKAVIFDIDGTLASHEGVRSPYDYTKVKLDKPRSAVVNAMKNYAYFGYRILICSGREDSCREDTVDWLFKYTVIAEIPIYRWNLFMRKAGDKRQDRIIKGEIFNEHIRSFYNVEAVYDDRDQVVELWRDELKLDCFQVNWGNF